MILSSAWSLLGWWLRPLLKWFLRRTTRLCELQRVCYGERAGAARCAGVERSLQLSRTPAIRQVVSFLDNAVKERTLLYNINSLMDQAVGVVTVVKKVDPHIHPQFPVSLHHCLRQIWSYRLLVQEVEDLRRTLYDGDNLDHETKLLQLWAALVPDDPLEGRITKQWQHIGFQTLYVFNHIKSRYAPLEEIITYRDPSAPKGDDPKTDFRGMGLLGLENLLYFATEYPRASAHALSHSLHPTYGYTFAIVGINLTSMAYHFLNDHSAKTYMFNAATAPNMQLFHKFYSYLFHEFDKLWIETKPENIMEFSMIFKRFENAVRNDLADPASVFRINLGVDEV